jgi:outer membrane protein TolC
MARRDLSMARNAEQKALLDLKAVIGIDLASEVTIPDSFAGIAPLPELAKLIQIGRDHRGQIAGASAKLLAAKAQVRIAQDMQRPQVYGTLMADTAKDEMMRGATAGITLSFPLYDGGERRADVRRMKAMQEVAEQKLRQAQIEVEKQIRQALLDLETAQANYRSSEESVTAAKAALEIVQIRVQAGKGILLEQVDALRVLTSANADLAQALFEVNMSRAQLARAMGITLAELSQYEIGGNR